jgi:hypothetical protein
MQISGLAFEIKQQWQLNKIIVIPLILSATMDIPNMLNQSHSAAVTVPHTCCPRSRKWSY